MNKAVSVGPLLLALLLGGCAKSGPSEADIRNVIQAELERKVSYTPGASVKVTDWSDLEYECKQGATPSDSDLYHCTLSKHIDILVRIEGHEDQNVEGPLKGVISFRQTPGGDWAVVSWEGA